MHPLPVYSQCRDNPRQIVEQGGSECRIQQTVCYIVSNTDGLLRPHVPHVCPYYLSALLSRNAHVVSSLQHLSVEQRSISMWKAFAWHLSPSPVHLVFEFRPYSKMAVQLVTVQPDLESSTVTCNRSTVCLWPSYLGNVLLGILRWTRCPHGWSQ